MKWTCFKTLHNYVFAKQGVKPFPLLFMNYGSASQTVILYVSSLVDLKRIQVKRTSID